MIYIIIYLNYYLIELEYVKVLGSQPCNQIQHDAIRQLQGKLGLFIDFLIKLLIPNKFHYN